MKKVNLGTEKNKNVALPYPLHPMLQRAYDVLEPLFIEQVLPEKGHGLLASPDQWNALIETIPDAAVGVRETLSKNWSSVKHRSTRMCAGRNAVVPPSLHPRTRASVPSCLSCVA